MLNVVLGQQIGRILRTNAQIPNIYIQVGECMRIHEGMVGSTYMGPYHVLGQIEEGTQAKILLGENKEKLYGLKVYKHGHQGRRSFENEAEILGRIEDELVVKPLEIYQTTALGSTCELGQIVQPFLVMQYFQNGDLRHFISSGPVPTKIRNSIIRYMAKCLLVMDSHEIVHRDIKPQNFLVDNSYNLKLIDFGVAIHQSQQRDELVGTLRYIAPEIHKSRTYSSKSDVFAAGVICFELFLAGSRQSVPFKEAKLTDSNFLLLRQKMYDQFWRKFPENGTTAQQKNFLQKILSFDPQERPSASEILGDPLFKQQASHSECSTFFDMLKRPLKICKVEECVTY